MSVTLPINVNQKSVTADHVQHFAATAFLVVAVVYSGSLDFYMADVNNFLLVN